MAAISRPIKRCLIGEVEVTAVVQADTVTSYDIRLPALAIESDRIALEPRVAHNLVRALKWIMEV